MVATLEYLRNLYVEERELPTLEPVPVAVCTALYNSTPFLGDYLTSVLQYDWPHDLTSLYFTVQGDDATYDVMKTFKETYGDIYRRIKVKRVKQVKGGELPHVRNVTQCRNLLVKWSKPDIVFFNDHDNFNPPISIKRLYDGIRLGADAAAGIYFFSQMDEETQRQMATFTAFFLHEGTMRGLTLRGMSGLFPLEIFNHRLWMDAVSFGCFLAKRELLDKQKFFVPYGTTLTDDTAFCLKAREKGFRFIADFGLLVPHWGFKITYRKMVHMTVQRHKTMLSRRRKMEDDGVYIMSEKDLNMTEIVKDFVDIDKIEKRTPKG